MIIRMSPVKQLRNRAKDALAVLSDQIVGCRRGLSICLLACLAVSIFGSVLDHRAWTRQQTLRGPFQEIDASGRTYAVEFGDGVPFWLMIGFDQTVHNALSNPYLQVDGRDINLPSVPDIYQGFKYWLGKRKRTISFGLPAGVTNDANVALKVSYLVRLHSTLHDMANRGSVLLLALLAIQSYLQGSIIYRAVWVSYGASLSALSLSVSAAPLLVNYLFTAVAFALRGASGLTILAFVGYFGSIGYGILAGDALPTATIFRLAPINVALAVEAYLPVAALLFAAAGTAFAWCASLGAVPVALVWETELRMRRLWGVCGLPVILASSCCR